MGCVTINVMNLQKNIFIVGLVILCWQPVFADAFRAQVEADWARQDQSRLAQIQKPGYLRFARWEGHWPGIAGDSRRRVPQAEAPVLDGRLSDACWQGSQSLTLTDGAGVSYRLACAGDRLFVAAAFPRSAVKALTGPATSQDAAGAVDGIKNGCYGFHTGPLPNPWWQVDLGAVQPLSHMVIYNRQDYQPGIHNADPLKVLASQDGREWQQVYDNGGRHFGGVSSGKPLTVSLKQKSAGNGPARPLRARYVRIQVPSAGPLFFHLDEVEIFGAESPGVNLALNRPARQSSLSIWSKGGVQGSHLLALDDQRFSLMPNRSDAILLNDQAAAGLAVAMAGQEKQVMVEMAIPLSLFPRGFPAAMTPSRGQSVPIARGASWDVAWSADGPFQFGRNTINLTVKPRLKQTAPVMVQFDVIHFTRFAPVRRLAFSAQFSAAAERSFAFDIDHEGASAVECFIHSREGVSRNGQTFLVAPINETLDRCAGWLDQNGGFRDASGRLAALRAEAAALNSRVHDSDKRSALYRKVRWFARSLLFAHPKVRDIKELLFVKRFTQETYPDVCLNHMPWVSRPGGDICILSLAGFDQAGAVRPLLQGKLGPGHVRGVDLSWDARRVVFGYAKAKSDAPPKGWLDRRTSFQLRRTEEPIHIFDIGVDGRGCRQLTHGEWSDLDPTCLPNGDVVFVSERCGYSLQCNEYDKDETSCNIYRMKADGSGIRRLSVTKDGDYLPHVLQDGTIGYTRWEYQERGWAHIQSLWFVRPDGTGADAIFKQHLNDPWALEDVRSIPGSERLVAIATGHHTLAAGPLVMIDPSVGMDNPAGIAIVTPGLLPPEGGMSGKAVPQGGVLGVGGFCMTPWALSDAFFLVSRTFGSQTDPKGYGLYLVGADGTQELVYRDPAISSFFPIPLRPRPLPYPLPDLVDPGVRHATCTVSNAAHGVEGIHNRDVRYIRIAQRLAWPYCNTYGGQRYEPDVKSVMVNWTPARILGTVPVEADGSARFRVPVDTPVYFQLLDKDFRELRRMRSFISFQPGEERACVGCHESRAEAPPNHRLPLAFLREPSEPTPPPWGHRPLSYLRDVQPVFDRYCIRCHDGMKPAAGLDFSGGLTSRHNRSYDTILTHQLIARSNVGEDARVTPPLAFGSRKSRLLDAVLNERHRKRFTLARNDWIRLVTWIDANGPYHDGFINKRQNPMPYDLVNDRALKQALRAVHQKRCSDCHESAAVSRLDWIDLTQSGESRFLKAPLAKTSGGAERCGRPVYQDRQDRDYQALRALVEDAVRKAWRQPRRDLKALDGWVGLK